MFLLGFVWEEENCYYDWMEALSRRFQSTLKKILLLVMPYLLLALLKYNLLSFKVGEFSQSSHEGHSRSCILLPLPLMDIIYITKWDSKFKFRTLSGAFNFQSFEAQGFFIIYYLFLLCRVCIEKKLFLAIKT